MSAKDIATFESIPWVSKLLRGDDFVTMEPWLHDKIMQDALFSKTLQTPTRIAGALLQYKKTRDSASPSELQSEATELRLFWLLGGSDLDGHPGLLHGGLVTTLLDQAMGFILILGGDYEGSEKRKEKLPVVTAYLNTKYLRPIRTPAAIMVHVKLLEKVEDRKWSMEATIYDSENRALASGESLFVRLKSRI